MKLELTHGKYATVDVADYDRCKQYNWHYRPSDGYAATNITIKGEYYTYKNGKNKKTRQKTLLLHHFIMGIKGREDLNGHFLDHKNGDRLDNRQDNLRLVKPHTNNQNRTVLNSNNTSGFRGPQLCKKTNKWRWRWQYKGEQFWSSYKFNSALDAYNDLERFKDSKLK